MLNWTKQRPTKPDWYWMRSCGVERVVEVIWEARDSGGRGAFGVRIDGLIYPLLTLDLMHRIDWCEVSPVTNTASMMQFTKTTMGFKNRGLVEIVSYPNFATFLLTEGPCHCDVTFIEHGEPVKVIVRYGKVMGVITGDLNHII